MHERELDILGEDEKTNALNTLLKGISANPPSPNERLGMLVIHTS